MGCLAADVTWRWTRLQSISTLPSRHWVVHGYDTWLLLLVQSFNVCCITATASTLSSVALPSVTEDRGADAVPPTTLTNYSMIRNGKHFMHKVQKQQSAIKHAPAQEVDVFLSTITPSSDEQTTSLDVLCFRPCESYNAKYNMYSKRTCFGSFELLVIWPEEFHIGDECSKGYNVVLW